MEINNQICLKAYEETFKSMNLSEFIFLPADNWYKLILYTKILNGTTENPPEIIAKFKENSAFIQLKIDYQYECIIELINMPKKMCSSLFKNNNYNYEIIVRIINDFYALGKKYTLIKNINEIKNLEIEKAFDKKSVYKTYGNAAIKERALTIVQFSNAFLTDKIKSDPQRSLKGKSLTVHYSFVVKNGSIHPIAKLDLPVSPNSSMTLYIDIHPDSKESSEIDVINYYKEFDEILKNRIDATLRKVYKLTNKFIGTMSFEEKMNYLTLIEMKEF